MSRVVPFEDPLLHPPTPPIVQDKDTKTAPGNTTHTQQTAAEPIDDGPIPFSSNPGQDNTVFSPPPFQQRTSHSKERPTKEEPAHFVDPLTGPFNSHAQATTGYPVPESTRQSSTSPHIDIPTTNNNMPTEFPTHLASPPLPQKPSSIGGTSFSAFQAFSSALQAPTTTGTPTSISTSAPGTPSMGQDTSLHPSTIGLGLDHRESEVSPLGHEWQKRHSIGISTNPSGISLQDHPDLVRQTLSPQQELMSSHSTPRQQSDHFNILEDQSPQHGQERHPGLRVLPSDQEGEHLSVARSTGFAVPSSPMRQAGFPVLNAHSMFHEITMSDPLNDLMVKYIPGDQRVLRDWSALTEAEQRQGSRSEILHELTINNSWRAMTRYTRVQILNTPPDRIQELLNLWYARLVALIKLGQYEMAQAELEQLGDLRGPQFRFENYPPEALSCGGQVQVPSRGSMVPFELLVLKARLQGFLGDLYEAIDQLYDLVLHCKKSEAICRVGDDHIGVRQWRDLTGQLHLMVLNYLVELKDYPTATKHAREMAKKYPQDVSFHSGLGRLYLQLGDLDRAEQVFKGVEAMVQEQPEQSHFKLQLTMNRALLAVTQGNWLMAKAAFEEVLSQEPENLAATNNLAVCELYAGQVNEAIPRIEKLMFAYPTSAGTSEPLVFNMATLYELRTEGSLRRKQQMMVETSKWAGDQFNVSVFKI